MRAGRPKKADVEELYNSAHLFYWELKSIKEGLFRIYSDRAEYDRLKRQFDSESLTEEIASIERGVSAQIEKGYLPSTEKAKQIQEKIEDLRFEREFQNRNEASIRSKREIRVRGEPEVIDELLTATKPKQIAALCKDAFTSRRVEVEPGVFRKVRVPNWPISSGSVLPMYLTQYAAQFIAAKNDPRFPKSSRPTNTLKQLWFLSRALSGALHGISTRTAINLIGSVRPDEMVEKSKRKRRKPKESRDNQS